MAKAPASPAGQAAGQQHPDPTASPPPRFWRYTAGVERVLSDLSLQVRDGDVLAADEPPGNPDWWVACDGPATVTPGASGFRVWTPQELQRGALAEDPPTTPGWTDPEPEPATTDDQATEADQ